MKNENLKLKNQICFPIYACAREIIKAYKPFLEKVGLTYTQYITMMVLWENNNINVKELGTRLHLDSGTLTPLLKRMERSGLIQRRRSEKDERVVVVTLTEKGSALEDMAGSIPDGIRSCVDLSGEEMLTLHSLLYKVLDQVAEEKH